MKAQSSALRELIQSDEPTDEDFVKFCRKARDQARARKAPSPVERPDPVEEELRQAGDQFKIPRSSTGIKITLSDWVSSWTREKDYKGDKRNALGFRNCGVKLE